MESKRVGRACFSWQNCAKSLYCPNCDVKVRPSDAKNHKKLLQLSPGAHKNTLLSLWNSEICRKRCRAIKKVSIKVGSALDRPPWSSFPWQCRGVWCGEQKGRLPWWSLAAISRCPSSLEGTGERKTHCRWLLFWWHSEKELKLKWGLTSLSIYTETVKITDPMQI